MSCTQFIIESKLVSVFMSMSTDLGPWSPPHSAPSKGKACKECARLKSKCDNKRPCARCSRLGRANECVDQTRELKEKSFSFDLSPPVVLAKQIHRACDLCRSKKLRCSGKLPCERCIKRDRVSECQYSIPVIKKSKSASEADSIIQTIQNPLWQMPSLDYTLNLSLIMHTLKDLSPLSVYESVTALSGAIGLEIFFKWSIVLLSPMGALNLFQGVTQILQELHNFSPDQDLEGLINKLRFYLALEPDSLVVKAITMSVIEVQDLASSSTEQKEVHDPMHFLQDNITNESMVTRNARLLIQSHLESSNLIISLNEAGQLLFGYKNEDLQRHAYFKDLENLQMFQNSQPVRPPAVFE
jgi:hypothetical protein